MEAKIKKEVDIALNEGERGTLFYAGLPLKAEHLRQEFKFILDTALFAVSAISPWRAGILPQETTTSFSNTDGNKLIVEPFRFMLRTGFVGQTVERLVIDKPSEPSIVQFRLYQCTKDITGAGEMDQSRRFTLRLDGVTKIPVDSKRDDNEDEIRRIPKDCLAMYWSNGKEELWEAVKDLKTNLWPAVADLRATPEWEAIATALSAQMLSLAEALIPSSDQLAAPSAVGVLVARSRAFPVLGPWWPDEVIENLLLAIRLGELALPPGASYAKNQSAPRIADSGNPRELVRVFSNLGTALTLLTERIKTPLGQKEMQFDRQPYERLDLEKTKSTLERQTIWECTIDPTTMEKDNWNAAGALFIIFLPKDSDAPNYSLDEKVPNIAALEAKDPEERWPDKKIFRFGPGRLDLRKRRLQISLDNALNEGQVFLYVRKAQGK